jgi:hypothetical protein
MKRSMSKTPSAINMVDTIFPLADARPIAPILRFTSIVLGRSSVNIEYR